MDGKCDVECGSGTQELIRDCLDHLNTTTINDNCIGLEENGHLLTQTCDTKISCDGKLL